jgi:hypothetical protein
MVGLWQASFNCLLWTALARAIGMAMGGVLRPLLVRNFGIGRAFSLQLTATIVGGAHIHFFDAGACSWETKPNISCQGKEPVALTDSQPSTLIQVEFADFGLGHGFSLRLTGTIVGEGAYSLL